MRYNYLNILNLRLQKKKITFKVVQIKFLAIHIINKKFSFDIFTNINKISSWNINLCLIS